MVLTCFLLCLQVFPTYHIYPPTAPHVAYMQPKANAPSFFMADELRQVRIQSFPSPSCPQSPNDPKVWNEVQDTELNNIFGITLFG